MKLLFLTKRRPQNKDLINKPYGRFYYIPYYLAKKGHEVIILSLSYKNEKSYYEYKNGIHWYSESIPNINPFKYISKIISIIKSENPDWIVGFSDTYFGILASYFGAKYNINSLIDAYDNYESYIPWCKPLHRLWQRAIKNSSAVTATSPFLAKLLNQYDPSKAISVIPMAADPNTFIPMDKNRCRNKLKLPTDKKLIGYCGAIYKNRGVEILFDAIKILKQKNDGTEFIMTGRKEKNILIPKEFKWLGYISDDKIPYFINSVDLLYSINKLSAFGQYSCPVKIYEAISCETPILASKTPSIKWILKDYEGFLVAPEDSNEIVTKSLSLLNKNNHILPKFESWEKITENFENVLFKYPPP